MPDGAAPEIIEFSALGPLEVRRNGEMVDLGLYKQRSLLALLLVNANQVVSTDRILDALWGDEAAGQQKLQVSPP